MHSKRLGWLLLAPTMIILFFFGVVPFFYVIWVSFHQWNPFAANPGKIFNWAANYRQVVFDAQLLASLGVTFAFVFFAVVSELVLGYLLAQAFMKDFPGKAFFRTIHTLPLIMAPIIVGSIWKLMTTPSIGIIPNLLQSWFGYNLNIGQSALAAFTVTVVMDVWHWTPLVTLSLIAALVSLPPDPFEQAQIDGAGKRQIFWHI
ncbi:MAG TPA: sugar ABC transporter permease, partial [Paracoccus sp. (in: a-proteobacteria)]|nr:sugar ABC transporter permease [Paracoccus sp. (in: a-proteobacteria)]